MKVSDQTDVSSDLPHPIGLEAEEVPDLVWT